MKLGQYLRVAIADLLLLALFGFLAWIVWRVTHTRVPAPIAWAATIAVVLLGLGGYLRQALPWWRARLKP